MSTQPGEQDSDVLELNLGEGERLELDTQSFGEEPTGKRHQHNHFTRPRVVIYPEWGKKCGTDGGTSHTYHVYQPVGSSAQLY